MGCRKTKPIQLSQLYRGDCFRIKARHDYIRCFLIFGQILWRVFRCREIESGAHITQFYMPSYYIKHCNDRRRTKIWPWTKKRQPKTHKRHHIAHIGTTKVSSAVDIKPICSLIVNLTGSIYMAWIWLRSMIMHPMITCYIMDMYGT